MHSLCISAKSRSNPWPHSVSWHILASNAAKWQKYGGIRILASSVCVPCSFAWQPGRILFEFALVCHPFCGLLSFGPSYDCGFMLLHIFPWIQFLHPHEHNRTHRIRWKRTNYAWILADMPTELSTSSSCGCLQNHRYIRLLSVCREFSCLPWFRTI